MACVHQKQQTRSCYTDCEKFAHSIAFSLGLHVKNEKMFRTGLSSFHWDLHAERYVDRIFFYCQEMRGFAKFCPETPITKNAL